MSKNNKIKPDVVMKEFWRVNERFADLFNGVLFQGKTVIRSDRLCELDTDMSGTIRWKDGESTLNRVRDIVKKEYDGVEFNILGVEIQDKVHYAMPLRTMIYDGLGYLKEYNDIKRKNKDKQGMSQNEFLSGMKKSDKLHPIFTIVLYYSEEPWDGPCSIKDMMVDMKPEFESIFTDYRMKLVQISDCDKYKFNNEDVRMVFDITRAIYDEDYENIYREYNDKNISVELLRMISVITESPDLMDIAEGDGNEEVNMCSALKKLQDESKLIGREEGRKEERIESIVAMIELGLTKEQIMTRYSEDEYNEASQRMSAKNS